MVQRYFIDSRLLPCSLRSHRTADPMPKNGLRHFSALPTHHPKMRADTTENTVEKTMNKITYKNYIHGKM